MTNLGYLAAACLVIWAAIWGYTLALGRRQRRLAREIERLSAGTEEER